MGRRAALLELGSELLVLTKRLLRILEVVLQVHDLHRVLAVLLRLRLNGLRRRLDFLLLRIHEGLELRNGGSLLVDNLLVLLLHGLQELLQDADDLTGRARLAGGRLEEVGQHHLGEAVHVAVDHDVLQRRRGTALQEPRPETITDQGSRALIIWQTRRGSFAAVSKPIVVKLHALCAAFSRTTTIR